MKCYRIYLDPEAFQQSDNKSSRHKESGQNLPVEETSMRVKMCNEKTRC